MAEGGGNAPDCSCWFCRLPEKCCEWRNIRRIPAVKRDGEAESASGSRSRSRKKSQRESVCVYLHTLLSGLWESASLGPDDSGNEG